MALGASYLRRMSLPYLVASGMTSNAVGTYFQAKGWGAARQMMQSEYRTAAGLVAYQKPIAALKQNTTMPKQFMVERKLRIERNYLLSGKATVFNADTGESYTKYVSMYSEELRSKSGWTDEYISGTVVAKYKPEESISDIEWISVSHNEGAPY